MLIGVLLSTVCLCREGQSRAKVLSNMVKQKRKEKAVNLPCDCRSCICALLHTHVHMRTHMHSYAHTYTHSNTHTLGYIDGERYYMHCSLGFQGKWTVPLPKVKAVGENEVFKVVKTGKTRRKFNCGVCVEGGRGCSLLAMLPLLCIWYGICM